MATHARSNGRAGANATKADGRRASGAPRKRPAARGAAQERVAATATSSRRPRAPARRAGDPTLGSGPVGALRKFRVVFNAVKAHFRDMEKKAGIGGASVWALSVIRANPGIGVTALARAMSIRQPTASNLVKALIERDMVLLSRTAGVNGVELRIRPAGTRVLRKTPGPYSGVLPAALESLDAETIERLNRDLDALLSVLGVDQSAYGTPLADL